MGDLPTALTYFQKAIDVIPDDRDNLRFKRNVLNQTGRLLHSLRLDSAAIEYMERSIAISEELKDNNSGIAYAHVLLADAYLNIKDLKRARDHINFAVTFSSNLSSTHRANILIDFSRILGREGKLDSALSVIRPLPKLVDSLAMSECLALASELYRDAGILDTAYIYARKLTRLKDPSNKRTGYKVIFSDNLRHYVPKDTLIALVSEYKNTIEEYIDRHEGENAIIQNTRYNYMVHDREREKAEVELLEAKSDRNQAISIGSLAILILIIIIIYIKYRQIKTEVKLRMAIQLVQSLDYSLRLQLLKNNHVKAVMSPYETEYEDKHEQKYLTNSRQDNLRKELLESLQSLSSDELQAATNDGVLQTPIVKKLHKLLSEDKGIKDDDTKTWKDIEHAVQKFSPEFKERLMVLSLGNMSEKEYRVALLMRCGFRPKEISSLLLRGKSTATDRRRSLTRKIFGNSSDNSALDNIIQRL
ncbi:MAG: tetratricopeptide repeat protein [Muribaculaceae bacterium]|nr:tetratricopeptide repeat protein [Muribaculaceae bacterium]